MQISTYINLTEEMYMANKWYKKASVQAAIITGVFLLAATIVTTWPSHNSSSYSPTVSSSSASSSGLSPSTTPSPSPAIEIADILVHQEQGGICLIDFRLVNKSPYEVIISRVRFKVLEFESIPPSIAADYADFTMIYDLDISNLQKEGDVIEYIVSQAIESGRTERFGIRVAAPNKSPVKCYTGGVSMKTSQWIQAVCGGIAVWQEYRNSNWNISGYTLLTEEKFQIASETSDKNLERW